MKPVMLSNGWLITIIGVALLFTVTACTTPEGNADDGKRWYTMQKCYACHGDTGKNGNGPIIDANNISFSAFLSAVRNAGSPIMPKYSEEKIPKQDVADIYAWLKTQ
jgi:mono/diheme cytochrome c family protein